MPDKIIISLDILVKYYTWTDVRNQSESQHYYMVFDNIWREVMWKTNDPVKVQIKDQIKQNAR